MTTIELAAWRAARRAYELGRLRTGFTRGLVVSCAVTALAVALYGAPSLVWMPLTLLAWTGVEWRGGVLRRGALRGLAAGAVTLVLPTTWLRACCAGMQSGAACSAPEVCAIAGGIIGAGLAFALPPATSLRTGGEGAFGAALGVLAVSAARCTSLLGGEALGVALGLTAGLAAGAWVTGRRAVAR